MKAERKEQLDSLFRSALEHQPTERAAFLAQSCAGDESLRQQVETLLASHENAAGASENIALKAQERQTIPAREVSKAVPRINESISHYKIIAPLGAGGMGQVYLAQDTKLGRQVALKLLPAEFTLDRDRLRRFQQEARAASALNHPNIITIYEIGQVGKRHFIITEHIDGQTLRQRLEKSQPNTELALSETLNIAIQVTEALSAAHEAGIVHRDIKPENIMIRRRDGYVKVLDFGLAKLIETPVAGVDTRSPTLPHVYTVAGAVIGTVSYMSPEQTRGIDVDPRSDIFSLGVVLYEMIAGRRPFEGQSTADVIASILRSEPAAITELVPDAPPEIDKIVSKTLSKDRKQRYQTSDQLLADLRAVRRAQDLQREQNEFTQRRSRGARFGWASLTLIILLLATVASVWLVTRPREGEQAVSFSSVRFAELYSWKSERGEAMLDAKFSHDGTRIAFTSLNHGAQTIWIKQLTQEAEPLPITPEKTDAYWPIWSPDDGQIAFISRRNNETGIWLVPAAGGLPTLLKSVKAEQTERTRYWSKDGRSIYYELDNNLHALDVASKISRQITNLPHTQSNRQFSISPDEKKIAYVESKAGQFDVWVATLKGGDTIQVTNDPAEDRYPIWHPDGKRLIYTSNRGGAYQVCVGYLDAQKPVQVTVGGADHVVTDVSKDGSKLLEVAARQDANIFRVGVDGRESEITSGLSLNLWGAVSPDGKTLAYQTTNAIGKLSSSSLMLRPTSGGQQQQIASDGFNVSWSHDSRRVAYLSQRGDRVDIFSVGIAGADEKQLTSGGITYSGYSLLPANLLGQDFSWSPRDGSKIAYCARKSGRSNVWTINADGSGETQITANSDPKLALSTPFWSPDGQRIAYLSNMSLPEPGKEVWSVWLAEQDRSQIIFQATSFLRLVGWSVSRDELIVAVGEGTDDPSSPMSVVILAVTPGGGRRAIASLKSIYVLTVQLSPDSQTIAFISDQDGMDNLWLVPVTGGTARKVTVNTDTKLYLSSPAWSPDGRTIYYSKQASWGVISMINNFR